MHGTGLDLVTRRDRFERRDRGRGTDRQWDPNVGPRLRMTRATGYELGDGARGGTFVLANVRNNEKFCLGVSVSVDGDERVDGYSPLGDFELELGGSDDNYLGYDDGNNAGGGDWHNCGGLQTGKMGDPTN